MPALTRFYRSLRPKRFKKKFFDRSDLSPYPPSFDSPETFFVFFHPSRRRISSLFDFSGFSRPSLIVPPRPKKTRSPSYHFFSNESTLPLGSRVFVSTSLILPLDPTSFFLSFPLRPRLFSIPLFYGFLNFCFSGRGLFFFLKSYYGNQFLCFIPFSLLCLFLSLFKKIHFVLFFPYFTFFSISSAFKKKKIRKKRPTRQLGPMPTFQQLIKGARSPKIKKCRTKGLYGAPYRKAVCIRVYTTTPKKPNSAIRKVAKVRLILNGRKLLAYIPGFGHNLSQHSTVLLRGGRVRDVPGMHYKLIRGKFDFLYKEKLYRAVRRSKYGYPNPRKSK